VLAFIPPNTFSTSISFRVVNISIEKCNQLIKLPINLNRFYNK